MDRKTVLFIAMSLDGYIADVNGGVDWLSGQGNEEENRDTYSEFIRDVDTVIMGWNTYEQIVTELSPDEWVYQDLTTYVVTHRVCDSSEQIWFTGENPADLLKRLKGQTGKKIWICGGANLILQLEKEDLIDEYDISIIPTLLGNGIRLFENEGKERKLRLRQAQTYNGITELIYERR